MFGWLSKSNENMDKGGYTPKIQESGNMLLCLCPSWGPEMPPLALGLLKNAMKHKGLSIDIRDLNIETYDLLEDTGFWDKSNIHFWTNPKIYAEQIFPRVDPILEEFSNQLAYGEHPYIGFSLMSSNVFFTNQLIERIKLKAPDKVIIAGGPALCFKHERERLRRDYDYYVIGEGEDVLFELWLYLENKTSNLPENVHLSRACEREPGFRQARDLNYQGSPDFTGLPLNKYLEKDTRAVIFTRSCLFKCRFCADHPSMGVYRQVDTETMYQTLKEYYDSGVRNIWFNDLLINGIVGQLVEVFERLEGEGVSFNEWIALATPNAQLKLDELKRLADYGLKTLNLGVETGSERVMKLMGKGFNRKYCIEGLKVIRDAGINTQVNVIVGFPGETEEDFQQSLAFFGENKHLISGFTSVNSCVLLPGSKVALEPEEFGIVLVPGQDTLTHWEIPGENNLEIRQDRLKRMIQWIKKQGYTIYSDNMATNESS
jgi:pyruvate-formate lyase-activating enzyme